MKDFVLLVAVAVGVVLTLIFVVVLMVLFVVSLQTPSTPLNSPTPAIYSHEEFNKNFDNIDNN